MRLAYSTAAVLVAVFASSHAMPTGVNANALPESDVSPVARVTDGGAYDADTQRLLRESFDDDDSALDLNPEERIDSTRISEAAAPITEKIASKGWRLGAADAWAGQQVFNSHALQFAKTNYKRLSKPLEWWYKFYNWLLKNPLSNRLLKPLKDHKVDGKTLRDHYHEAYLKYEEIYSAQKRIDEWGTEYIGTAPKDLEAALKKVAGSEQYKLIETNVNAVVKDLNKLKFYRLQQFEQVDAWTVFKLAWTKFEAGRNKFNEDVRKASEDFQKVSKSEDVAEFKTIFTELAQRLAKIDEGDFLKIARVKKPEAAASPTVNLPEPLPGSPLGTPGTPKDSNPKVE
ncbi:unnamed protein product [Hyaloperonospora brassicae]|uniref:RxLR effector protein n=1 Tax=Hyaloperonospora brassicae TaxID=162125 RepID=A0AAV0T954_HYABA|nr:unnamed protein product [Hyaloperonospora brassicae]